MKSFYYILTLLVCLTAANPVELHVRDAAAVPEEHSQYRREPRDYRPHIIKTTTKYILKTTTKYMTIKHYPKPTTTTITRWRTRTEGGYCPKPMTLTQIKTKTLTTPVLTTVDKTITSTYTHTDTTTATFNYTDTTTATSTYTDTITATYNFTDTITATYNFTDTTTATYNFTDTTTATYNFTETTTATYNFTETTTATYNFTDTTTATYNFTETTTATYNFTDTTTATYNFTDTTTATYSFTETLTETSSYTFTTTATAPANCCSKPGERLVNGGFEQQGGWATKDQAGVESSTGIVNGNQQAGVKSWKFQFSTGVGDKKNTLYQTISTCTGTTYKFIGYSKQSSAGKCYIDWLIDGAAVARLNPTESVHSSDTFTFVATGESTEFGAKVTCTRGGASSALYVDSFSIRPVEGGGL